MVNGGPFPATSDPATTSVGTLAIEGFLRPVAYQSLPDTLWPEPVRDDNPRGLTRLVDGRLEPGAAHTRHCAAGRVYLTGVHPAPDVRSPPTR